MCELPYEIKPMVVGKKVEKIVTIRDDTNQKKKTDYNFFRSTNVFLFFFSRVVLLEIVHSKVD